MNADLNTTQVADQHRRSRRLLLVAACVLAALSLLLVVTRPRRTVAGLERKPVPVLVVEAATRDIPVRVQAIGSVQPYSLVSIRSQITGPIVTVHFTEGQEVAAGDLLFTIDPRPWQAALDQAEANLKRDQAQLVSARLDFDRTKSLYDSRIGSRHDFESAEANFQALEATVSADAAAISNAQVSLSYTTIRSPIDGRTGNVSVKKGNVVKAPDDVLLTITQVRPIYVCFSIPEQQLPAIRQASAARVLKVDAFVPSDHRRPDPGQLTFVNNMVDTNTGTIQLKGTFANDDDLLWPGQFVQVSLTLSNLQHAVVIPSQAIQTGQDGEFVFVVQSGNTVTNVPVTTGISYDGVTVIGGDIHGGDRVVTDGQLRLVPGSRVEVKKSLITETPANPTPKL